MLRYVKEEKMSYTRRTKSSLGRNGGEDRSITKRASMNELMKRQKYVVHGLKTECFVRKEVEGGS